MAKPIYSARLMITMKPEDAAELEAVAAQLQAPVTVVVRQMILAALQQIRGAQAPRPQARNGEHREAMR